MTAEGDTDSNALLRSLLESLASDENAQLAGANPENVAQLLAAAIAQVGHTILAGQGSQAISSAGPEGGVAAVEEEIAGETPAASSSRETLPVNPPTAASTESDAPVFDLREAYESVPQASTLAMHDANVVSTVEVPTTSEKPRPLCVKFPLELRKRIISMRKEGKLSKDIAKELKVSVSGVQKVWERFLATGMAHDRKPSTYAGRPRKSTYSLEVYSPGFDLQPSDDIFPSSSHVEYVATPTSATPTTSVPTSDVIITEENEVFTEGATVEIVETTPLTISQPKSPKKKGAPPYRGRLLLKIVEGCPLATMRASPEAVTNPHVQNLMTSITRPLYLEYVLGHPFGKVPPSQSFDGCTSSEAEIILTDPANPVGKKLLAALGYSTKVYFNACCKPSPLFDTERLLSTLPISLAPAHLASSMKNVLQLLIDLCTNPEEALNRLPAGAGLVLVARNGDTVMASHSVPAPSKLSEFWTQLYGHLKTLECCENFISAHAPSAPCLLCHPFETFAQSLELKEPEEEVLTPLSPLCPSRSHFASDPHPHTEVEVQVLESGTSGLTSVPLPLSRQGRGKGRRQSKTSEKQPSVYSMYEEQNVVSDGEFEIPVLAEHQGSEVVVSDSRFLSTAGPSSECQAQEEASEAAQNLAFLATHVTSMANNSQDSTCVLGGPNSAFREVSISQTLSGPSQPETVGTTTTVSATSSENESSEIVAVAEVESSSRVRQSHSTLATLAAVSSASSATTTSSALNVTDSSTMTGGVLNQTQLGSEAVMNTDDGGASSSTKSGPEMVRRSLRKVTRARRFLSEEEAETPPPSLPKRGGSSQTPKRTSARRKGMQTQEIESHKHFRKSPVVLLEDVLASPPPAKRTRSRAGKSAVTDVEGGVATGGGRGHPAEWGVADVGEFISGIPQCAGLKAVFMEHLVDGETLLSLDPQMMVKLMDIKTGPALRIHRKITSLKKDFDISY